MSKIKKGIFSLFLLVTLVFAFLWLSINVNPEQIVLIYGSNVLYDSDGKLFHVRLSKDSEWHMPIPLNEMGKWLPVVAVNAEDGRFYKHIGVDALALLRAATQDLVSGHVVSGASTITSQLIRLAISEHEHRPRNPATKVREFIMAMKLERELSKDKILECYLNLAPFGGNIRGVQAASLVYFGKPASKISPGEACLLIGMLKGPTLYRPDTRPLASRKRRDEIIDLMAKKKIFTPEERKRALLEDLPEKKNDLPSRAWHFAEIVLSSNPESSRLNTTLKLETQTKLEAILKQSASELPPEITLAAGIVDNSNASLVAWVGNARFDFSRNDGKNSASWVDCGRSPRSPGSTLKPFAYLAAIEQGNLTPSTLLADTSMAFSGRAPRNFDLQYHGAVTARVALSESLNAPAVRVLRMAGPERVLNLMREAGLKHLSRPANYYGDSLILGGCEITLLEELEAFCSIASLGIHRPLAFLQGQTDVPVQIASKEGCWLVNNMLNHRGQLSLFARGTLGQKWQVALKTGTSYGLRDAWAAAWTPDYTTVVWAGSPEGTSWTGLVGARTAAPVAMNILRAVSPRSEWYEKPEKLELRQVCSVSGRPPTAACPSVKLEWGIKDVTKTIPCDMHRIKAGQTVLTLPAEFDKSFGADKKHSELSIISPIPGASYFAAPFDNERKIPMKAEGAVDRVWWYLDGEYIGTSLSNSTFFHPIPDGTHMVSATDSEGRSAKVNVKVLTPGKRKASEESLF